MSQTVVQISAIKGRPVHSSETQPLRKTPTGKYYTLDLVEIYCVLLLKLELRNTHQRSSLFGLRQSYSYTFATHEAIAAMAQLDSRSTQESLTTLYRYTIPPQIAQQFLDFFCAAHLLHCPSDRTRHTPKLTSVLQPSPKGVAILHQFCDSRVLDDHAYVPILDSAYDSMDLFTIERSAASDNIYLSGYLVKLLFAQTMGRAPNVWTSQLDENEDFNEVLDQNLNENSINFFSPKFKSINPPSPFQHRFFSNPESDAHVQYHVSRRGVRGFWNRKIAGDVVIGFCFSGHALWQWLMDCTQVFHAKEARIIGQMFLEYGYIEPCGTSDGTAAAGGTAAGTAAKFRAHRNTLYRVTPIGKEICGWDAALLPRHSDSFEMLQRSNNLSEILADIMNDAGKRYVFRQHLQKSSCAENFDCYNQLRQFRKRVRGVEAAAGAAEYGSALNECLVEAYGIYSQYLMFDSRNEVNIGYSLKDQIMEVMSNPQSPIVTSFQVSTSETSPISLAPNSPANFDLDRKVRLVEQIKPLFNSVAEALFRMMLVDSLPKFIESSDMDKS